MGEPNGLNIYHACIGSSILVGCVCIELYANSLHNNKRVNGTLKSDGVHSSSIQMHSANILPMQWVSNSQSDLMA